MPALKVKPEKLQCPFCSTISSRGTGLSAHVRGRHPKEYAKWAKNPSRLLEAGSAASPHKKPAENPPSRPVRPAAKTEVREEPVQVQSIQEQPIMLAALVSPISESDGRQALGLLQEAHEQLRTRKQALEREIARIEVLKGERDAVTAQLAALEQAMKAFDQQPGRQAKAPEQG